MKIDRARSNHKTTTIATLSPGDTFILPGETAEKIAILTGQNSGVELSTGNFFYVSFATEVIVISARVVIE